MTSPNPSLRTCRTRAAAPRRALAIAVVGLLPVLGVLGACSDDDGGDDAAATTTTEATDDGGDATTTTAADDGATTTTSAGTVEPDDGAPGEGDDPAGEWGELDAPTRSGTVEAANDQGSTTLDLRRDGARAELRTGELTLQCLPLLEGEPTTRTTEAVFTDLEVAADGSVDAVLPEAPFKPALTGFFAEDGSFTGSIYFNDAVDDYACGGEFPLLVPAP